VDSRPIILVPFETLPLLPAHASQSPANGSSEKCADAHHYKAGSPIGIRSSHQAAAAIKPISAPSAMKTMKMSFRMPHSFS